MAKSGVHTVMVTDIIKDNNGSITHIEITENTSGGNDNYNVIGGKLGGVARRLWWTIDDFPIKWKDYMIVRYNKISAVKYTPSPYVPMPDEQQGYAPYTMAILPYMGNKFRYVTGATNLDDILKLVVTVKGRTYISDSANVVIDDKNNVVIEKYNEEDDVWEEIGVEQISYSLWVDDTHPYAYVSLANDSKYKQLGEYRAFAFVNRSLVNDEWEYTSSDGQSSGKTSLCYWSVVDVISLLPDY